MIIFQKIDKTSGNEVWSKIKMLQVARKSFIPSEKKRICVSPGRFPFDEWHLEDFGSCQDKRNCRSSEGDPPLKSIISAFLRLSGWLSSSSLVSCQAGGFGASWWRARKTSAITNMSALISEHQNKQQKALHMYDGPLGVEVTWSAHPWSEPPCAKETAESWI